MIVLEYILLVGVIVCAIAAPLCKRLLASVIVYMALSLMMAVLWSLLQSPDLAITEAAVGAGVTSILFFLTLKKIHALKGTRMSKKEEQPDRLKQFISWVDGDREPKDRTLFVMEQRPHREFRPSEEEFERREKDRLPEVFNWYPSPRR